MLAQQLCEEIAASREGAPNPLFPAKFFVSGITITHNASGLTESRNPRLCATTYGAARLANVLYTDCGIPCTVVTDFAVSQTGITDSAKVPFLQFEGGVRMNAGMILDCFWNHNFPALVARNNTECDVTRTLMEAAGAPSDDVEAAIRAILAKTE